MCMVEVFLDGACSEEREGEDYIRGGNEDGLGLWEVGGGLFRGTG